VTYHAAVLLEWDHGRHCTLVELAWWNGIGGYGGKSNWVHDKLAKPAPALYDAMPPCMKGPWCSDRAEIRAFDVPAKTLEEFEAYLHKYSHEGHDARFLEPEVAQSADVCLSHRSQVDIMRALLNYVACNGDYVEESQNCQTFAADFFSYITSHQVQPFHPVCRVLYQSRVLSFLYGPPFQL